MLDQAAQQSPTKAFSLTKTAIQATAVIIETDRRKRKKRIPKGRELIKLAVKHYRSSIESGPDNHLGTAEPKR